MEAIMRSRKSARAYSLLLALTMCGIPALAQSGKAAAPELELPAGVKGIRLGAAVRETTPSGGESCSIKAPLQAPLAFPRGTTEISYTLELDCGAGRVEAKIAGPSLSAIKQTNCNAYGVSDGSICQTQIGGTVSLPGKKAFPSGQYKLEINAGGKTVAVPFRVD
jgi:hypothetical protein